MRDVGGFARCLIVGWLVCAGAACGGHSGTGGGGAPPFVDLGGGAAVAYQIDPAHSGNQPASTLRPPLTKRWSVDLMAPVSYALLAGGRAFVTVDGLSKTGLPIRRLSALDLATGKVVWGPTEVGRSPAHAAFDDGKVYVVNSSGETRAYDAATGAQVWTAPVLFPQSGATAPPVAQGGRVFIAAAGDGGTIASLDGKSGAIQWSARVSDGSSPPAVGQEGLFFQYGCLEMTGYEPASGGMLWHNQGKCGSASNQRTPALYQGQLWIRSWPDGNQVLDAHAGSVLGTFEGDLIPAFLDTRAFVLLGATLNAIDRSTLETLWAFTGDGSLTSAPLVVGGVVYIASGGGALHALDPATGQLLWTGDLGARVTSDHFIGDFGAYPLVGLTAGQGVLVAPAGSLLVAFE